MNCYSRQTNQKKGFTLAEIIITLGIIAVVAEITIPILVKNVQTQMYATAYRKIYSDLAQAGRSAAGANGGTLIGISDGPDPAPPWQGSCLGYDFTAQFIPYMSYSKYCTNQANDGDCFHKNSEFYYSNGTPAAGNWHNRARVRLNNGMLLQFTPYDKGWYVDLNGFKKPNTMGKDICCVAFDAKGNVKTTTTGTLGYCNMADCTSYLQ